VIPYSAAPRRDESISASDIFRILWNGRWWALAITTVSLCVGLAYAFTATPWYRAEVLLKPAEPRSPQGLAGQLGALGDLAGLAGISVGNNTSSEPIAVLTSREFAADFIREQNLLPVLFADKWDSAANRWKTSGKDQPDIRDGVRYFDKYVLHVVEDKKTNLVTMNVDWTDAATACAWANMLVARVNDVMRKRALTEAQDNVGYLKQELANSSLVTLQQATGRVLETELQKLMLANVSKEFAFKTIDHAQVPKWRYSPRRPLVISGAFIFGVTLSILFLLLRDAVRRYRDQVKGAPTSTVA
jgi:uncharacterized protein involved in exopolysaccharide biosynthesis